MRDFHRNNSDHDRPYGRKSQFGNRFDKSRPTVMYDAVCSNCGKDCKVPFRPTGEKPVLCRDCFRQSGAGQDRRPDNRNFSRPNFPQNRPQNVPQNNDYKAQLDALTVKVDKILEILNAATKAQVEEEVKEVLEPKTETIEKSPKKKRKSTKKSE